MKKDKITLFLGGYDGIFFLENFLSSTNNNFLIENVICTIYEKKIDYLCKTNNKSLFTIKSIDEFFRLNIDLNSTLVSCGYQKLIPKEIFNSFKWGAINVHAGILPQYKGIHGGIWAQINKEKILGSTCHLIDENFDSGNILYISKFRNSLEYDKPTLNMKLHLSNFDSFKNGYKLLKDGYKGTPQKNTIVWRKRVPSDSQFNPNEMDLNTFEHFHRALNRPDIYPYFISNNKKIVVIEYTSKESNNYELRLKDRSIYLLKFKSEEFENSPI